MHTSSRIGNRRRLLQVKARALFDLVRDEHHITQHRKQVFLDAADHLPVHKRAGRGVADIQAYTPGMAHDMHIEVLVAVEEFLGVVAVAAGVQDRERALAKQRMDTAATGVEQDLDFGLRQVFKAAARADTCVDNVG